MNGRIGVVCALVLALSAAAGIAAAEQSHRVLAVGQPPVVRIVEASRATTLNQAPNQVNGIFSDESCDFCGNPQVVAENFEVGTGGAGFQLAQIVMWGGFYPNDTPPAVDDFDVLVHADAAGSPGAVICSQTGIVPTSRTTTGVVLFGVHEYLVTIDLASACTLADGTYWAEVYDNTGAGTDDWFWETGTLDVLNGIAGSAWAVTAPGSAWNLDGATDMAVQLNGTIVPVELQSLSVK